MSYEVAVFDENLMKFRGRLSYVQFSPSKCATSGINFFILCDSSMVVV